MHRRGASNWVTHIMFSSDSDDELDSITFAAADVSEVSVSHTPEVVVDAPVDPGLSVVQVANVAIVARAK